MCSSECVRNGTNRTLLGFHPLIEVGNLSSSSMQITRLTNVCVSSWRCRTNVFDSCVQPHPAHQYAVPDSQTVTPSTDGNPHTHTLPRVSTSLQCPSTRPKINIANPQI